MSFEAPNEKSRIFDEKLETGVVVVDAYERVVRDLESIIRETPVFPEEIEKQILAECNLPPERLKAINDMAVSYVNMGNKLGEETSMEALGYSLHPQIRQELVYKLTQFLRFPKVIPGAQTMSEKEFEDAERKLLQAVQGK